MMSVHLLFISCLLATGLLTGDGKQGGNAPTEAVFLFSYFKGNGEDGLHLAYSRDGFRWTALSNDSSFLVPQVGSKLMRDPCICRGPDGLFRLVWTTGWWDQGIGIAHSSDLIHWSEQQWLPVMEHEPKARNCWAPEIFYDDAAEQYVIFWSTTIPGRFPETDSSNIQGNGEIRNHRVYYITTKDFVMYSKAKLLYNDGFNVIDATMFKNDGTYYLFLKDETRFPVVKKNIRVATSDHATGPYGHASDPISPNWVEGPSVLRVGAEFLLYYDAYTRGTYEGSESRDLVHWESITDKLTFPAGTRHGTAFTIDTTTFEKLVNMK
jgi:beta-xylosidase